MKRKRKPASALAERKNISLGPHALRQCEILMKLRGETKLSRLLARLVGEECERRASLNLKLARFIQAFDRVFVDNWSTAQEMIRAVSTDDFLTKGAYPDWESHDALYAAYVDLYEEMTNQKLVDPDI